MEEHTWELELPHTAEGGVQTVTDRGLPHTAEDGVQTVTDRGAKTWYEELVGAFGYELLLELSLAVLQLHKRVCFVLSKSCNQ